MVATPKYVGGYGSMTADIMLVGQAPNEYDELDGLPFTGPSGKYLYSLLKEAGINFDECYRTNVYKFRPPENDIERIGEVITNPVEHVKELYREISQINPKVIIALGDTALSALTGKTGIAQYRGSILKWSGRYKVIPTYHPAEVMTGKVRGGVAHSRTIVIGDLERALSISRDTRIDAPHRTIQVAYNSATMYNFIKEHQGQKLLSTDIETPGHIPFCVGLAFNPHRALCFPLYNRWGLDIPSSDIAQMWMMFQDLLKECKLIGHNFKFDHTMLERLCHFPMPDGTLHADTHLMAHTLYSEFPLSLDFLLSVHTLEPYYKNERIDFDPKIHSVDQYLKYCGRDAVATFDLYSSLNKELHTEGLSEFYYSFVNKLHDLYRAIEKEGLQVDEAQRIRLLRKYYTLWAASQEDLNTIAGGHVNPNSSKQVPALLTAIGYPVRKSYDEDTLVALQANHGKTEPMRQAIDNIIKIRKVRKTISTYLTALPDPDGKMRTQYKITGTENGRTSTTALDSPIRPIMMGAAFQVFTKHGDIGGDLTTMYVAEPGHVLVNVDLSQAEARVIALLCNDDDLLNKFGKVDVHKEVASICMDKPIESITKDERFIGKTGKHAANLNVKKKRFMLIVNTDAKKYGLDVYISEWKAGQYLEKIHRAYPKIRGVYHHEIAEYLRMHRKLVSPHGRIRKFFGAYDDQLTNEANAFIPQATVSDQTKLAALECKKAGLRIVLEGHDALMFTMKETEVEAAYKEVIRPAFEKPIDFSGCSLSRGSIVIPTEIEIGVNYKELEKVTYE